MTSKGPETAGLPALDRAEQELKECYHRLEVLERNLRYLPLTEDQREQTEKDVEQLKKILKQHEDELKVLRKENRASTLLAVLLIIGSFLIFGVYHMFVKSD